MCSRLLVLCIGVWCGFAWADAPRDPTQPPGRMALKAHAPELAGAPKLSSVLIGGGRRLAVVDGEIMGEGEERAGVKVWEIKPDRVVVSVAGRRPMTLLLDSSRVHKEVR